MDALLRNIDEILKEEKAKTSIGSYNISYPHFLAYFKGLNDIQEHNVVIAANFTYGWMPTILKNLGSELKEAAIILNAAKNYSEVSIKDFSTLQGVFNGSIVGASKVLHFVNPERYPIWDSNVCFALYGKAFSTLVNNVNTYLKYTSDCHAYILTEEYHKTHKKILQELKLDKSTTKLRTLELSLFLIGKHKREAKNN